MVQFWNDPAEIPLANGPMRTVTQAVTLMYRLTEDMQMIEFMLPFPVYIKDPQPWPPIKCTIKGTPLLIQKPLMSMNASEPNFRIGNEAADAYCTVLQVATLFAPNVVYPLPEEVWQIIQCFLAWMRIKACHYWLLHGQTGFGSAFRGSVILQTGKRIGIRNFSVYGQSVVVRPLSREIWLTLQNEICSAEEIPVYESLFCDALVSIVAGERLKAVLELGVAAETAITQLLSDAANGAPTTPAKRKFVQKGERDSFYEKLNNWPGRLGLGSPVAFVGKHISKTWIDEVKELYRYRGGVAHSGRSSPAKHVASYMHATNALLGYCRQQRERHGLRLYSYPTGQTPYDQIMAFTDVKVSSETNTVYSDLG